MLFEPGNTVLSRTGSSGPSSGRTNSLPPKSFKSRCMPSCKTDSGISGGSITSPRSPRIFPPGGPPHGLFDPGRTVRSLSSWVSLASRSAESTRTASDEPCKPLGALQLPCFSRTDGRRRPQLLAVVQSPAPCGHRLPRAPCDRWTRHRGLPSHAITQRGPSVFSLWIFEGASNHRGITLQPA